MTDLDELLDRLREALPFDGRRNDVLDAIDRALAALLGRFEDLAVVRGGRLQVALLRTPGSAHLLIAEGASSSDRAALRARLQRDNRTLAIVAELLGLALGLPGSRPRALARRAGRIVELGAELAAL